VKKVKVMTVKERIKAEIDYLDEGYLELALNLIKQLPHTIKQNKTKSQGEQAADILQEIADTGGLGISEPLAWQCEIRKERDLPGRSN
jgi:hypothetical protein